jgi:hypothetical protein
MLFRETVAVHCENCMEHTNTLCGQNAVYINSVRTSQETHYVSATKHNWLMLFGERVAVYFENHTEHRYRTHSCVWKQVVHILITGLYKETSTRRSQLPITLWNPSRIPMFPGTQFGVTDLNRQLHTAYSCFGKAGMQDISEKRKQH